MILICLELARVSNNDTRYFSMFHRDALNLSKLMRAVTSTYRINSIIQVNTVGKTQWKSSSTQKINSQYVFFTNHNDEVRRISSTSPHFHPVPFYYVIKIDMRSCYILCVLAAAVRLAESFSPLTAAGGGRPTTFSVPQQSLTSQQQQVSTHTIFSIRLSAIDDSSSESSDAASDNDESTSDSSASVPAPAVPRVTEAPRNPNANPKRIDPLMASLMRSTVETKAPTRNLPILGEVVMDQSLFLIVPAVVFGFLGFVFSIYVAVNSQEAFTEALEANPYLQSAGSAPEGEGCRGICSSQQDDLDQLRVFMNGLGK
jgi:hypothetical protein